MNQKKSLGSTEAIKELVNIVSKLRSPIGGCPWDLEQTHISLIPYLLEEAYEVADAIRHYNDENLKEELGDLLLQIILHAQIAQEQNRFCLKDVVLYLNQKLIRRHPHVFGKMQLKTVNEVKESWELIKIAEKKQQESKTPFCDELKRKIRPQSAILGSIEISKKVSNIGFEWKTAEDLWENLFEEIAELKEAINNEDSSHAQKELGDVIFTLINVARWFQLNPEEGLAGTNDRFLKRFSYIESQIDGEFSQQSSTSLKKLWQMAKDNLKEQN